MKHTPSILLVEDDRNFGDVLKSYLEMNDFEVTLATDGVSGFEKFRRHAFDLCILDVMMPKKDGFTLASEIREKDKDTPIIFLTAKTLKEDLLTGFRMGADDYVTKPFHSEELLARIQAVLKRSKDRANEPEEFDFGHYHFNFPLRDLVFRAEGREEHIKLSPKEAALLHLFCLHLNGVLTRSEALTRIWGEDNYFTARSMDVFVTKLRKHLSLDDRIEIVNIHGNGFQLLVKEGKSA